MDTTKTCECCATEYDYTTEPAEVKEGGQYICPECWNEDN
jgi:superfamily II helicase